MPRSSHPHQLTDYEKGQIEGRRTSMTHAEISHKLDIPWRTVSNFLQRLDKRDTTENLSHPGAPRKTTSADDRYIVWIAESSTRIPFAQLRNETNLPVSEQTLRRHLCEAGIRKWKAVNRPLLTKQHAKKRLEWARAHRHWIVDNWRKVLWSDECSVAKDSDTREVWVFRRQNKHEKYLPQNIRGKSKSGNLSQMMWATFVSDKLGPIVFFQGNVNSQAYISMLEQNLLPFLNALRQDDITDLVFQQDNAPAHTSKKTKAFLEAASQQPEHGFTIMDWPPNSPDMNPIEHLWAHIKLELHKRYPDTMLLQGSPDHIRKVLRQRLMEVWWEIVPGVLNRLVESMPQRVLDLIHAHGWYTDW